MVPPHHPQPSRPFGLSPIRVGKKVTIEEVPEDHRPSGRPNGLHGSRTQPRGETHPAGDHHHAPPGNQPRQQGSHCAHSPGRGHDNNMKQPARDQKTEPKPRETEGVPQTHEQEFSAPAVGATPLNPGVFLHTSANPTMALGYTQSYSFLPNQANATQGSAVPNTTAAFPAAVGNPQQPAALAANLGANLPTNTTYIGAPSMTYGEMDFQHGAPNHPQGLHFQPPVPDTTYGPMTHVYVPRHDGAAPPTVAGGAVQVCYPHSYAQWPAVGHVPVATRPATALVPVQVQVGHASFVPSYSLYASRVLPAALVVALFCFLSGWGVLEVSGWIVLLFLVWLLVSAVDCVGFSCAVRDC